MGASPSGAAQSGSDEFVREPLGVQERITSDGSSPWPVEADRYRLVAARACPWANRAVILRRLLGLEPVISLGIAGPLHDERSWRFHLDPDDKDPVLGIEYLRSAYEAAVPGYDKGVTVPAVVEVASGKVVTNDYKALEFDLATQWTEFHRDGAPDLFPDKYRDEIEEVSEGVFHDVNNGVYRCGFAKGQESYEKAYAALFGRLDVLSERLSRQRYLVGDTITEADVRLWATLVRFDAAYHGHFKCNRQKLSEMPVLWAYARDLFQTPGFGDTIDFEQIKQHYYGVHHELNPTGIIPAGPDVSNWLTAHGREDLGGTPFGGGTPPGPPPPAERVPALT
jgi:putative glutathione S-transferase